MKKNNKVIAVLAATAIIALSFSSTSAMWNGQWKWSWNGFWKVITSEEKTKLQSLSWDEKTEYMNELKVKYNVSRGQGKGQWRGNREGQAKQSGHNEKPADMIADIPMSDVSDTEKELLINQYGEERMARDLYAYASEKYPNVNTFGNITKSEQKHMDTLQVLLDRYSVSAPSDYAADNELYNTLKTKIDLSEKDAIEVGIMIEKVDIDNIVADIKGTDNDDFKIILTNIGWASYNHLRGFVKALDNAGYTTDIDYSDYLWEDDINTKGPIKVKLAEKLEAEWVKLPEQVSSESLKNKKCNKNWKKWNWKNEHTKKNNVWSEKQEKYKKSLESKYGKTLDMLDNSKLKLLVDKIDDLLDSINTWDYTKLEKVNYNALLFALKELSLDRILN